MSRSGCPGARAITHTDLSLFYFCFSLLSAGLTDVCHHGWLSDWLFVVTCVSMDVSHKTAKWGHVLGNAGS